MGHPIEVVDSRDLYDRLLEQSIVYQSTDMRNRNVFFEARVGESRTSVTVTEKDVLQHRGAVISDRLRDLVVKFEIERIQKESMSDSMAIRKSVCAKCNFFEQKEDQSPDMPAGLQSGLCRRHAPRCALDLDMEEDALIEQAPAIWPVVRGDDWCGDFG